MPFMIDGTVTALEVMFISVTMELSLEVILQCHKYEL